jgi:hypothetical protein
MAWIDRLIDFMPDTPEGVGGLAMLVGSVAAGAALMLANLPLAVGAVVLSVGGFLGPAVYAMKQKATPPDPALSASLEAQEDAAVDAFVLRMEAEGRYQAMVANERRRLRSRSH